MFCAIVTVVALSVNVPALSVSVVTSNAGPVPDVIVSELDTVVNGPKPQTNPFAYVPTFEPSSGTSNSIPYLVPAKYAQPLINKLPLYHDMLLTPQASVPPYPVKPLLQSILPLLSNLTTCAVRVVPKSPAI